ncbi:MAG: WecB/TagA/CpsF family glycosyltransferase [Synechococcales bacterium]|nr:WecB/TagA/CpsF family glycosyltransferase [Synechococcales bacterium]
MITNSSFPTQIPVQEVIGLPVTALTFNQQISLIVKWGRSRLSKVVCVANVHMLVEACEDAHLASVLNNADLVTPDGMPLVWMLRLLLGKFQDRVAGQDILVGVCQEAQQENLPVFFVGSDSETLWRMRDRLQREFPNLRIAGMEPLPFGNLPLPQAEELAVIDQIHASEAGIVFVSLGCPKQEKWMASKQDQIQAVMVGVGGVFPVYAGIHRRAPKLIRELGLEWLYRLVQEPKRLWGRYRKTIPPFLWRASKQLWEFRSQGSMATKS